MALLAAGSMGPKAAERPSVSVELRNELSEIQRLNQIVDEFAAQHDLASELVFRLHLVLEEILTNVISYGYEDALEHQIRVRLSWRAPSIEIEIEDDGRAFNPLEAPEPEMAKPLVERRVGGLGIHLVRNMVDDLDYRREAGENRLVLRTRTRETRPA
jgi:serine/threonine-protein kinase RsbW